MSLEAGLRSIFHRKEFMPPAQLGFQYKSLFEI